MMICILISYVLASFKEMLWPIKAKLKNQNSKQVKGFDDGEVNKQSVTKIESLFLEIDVIAFKQFSKTLLYTLRQKLSTT
jgi:hypothetical protein